MWRELAEANEKALYVKSIGRAIRGMSEHVLEDRVVRDNNHVLSVCTVAGGRRVAVLDVR